MRRATILVALLLSGPVHAQTSASFDLQEHAVNAGGNPNGGVILTSASFQISLDSLGDHIVAVGMSSGSFQIDSGFLTGYPPPGEVSTLRLLADGQTLEWDPEGSIGSYNLYRDLLSSLSSLGYGGCELQGLTNETAIDADAVPSGDGYFYLMTAENRLAEEGTKGFHSDTTERTGAFCP